MRIALSLGALARAEIGFFAPNSDRVDYKTAKTTCELYGAEMSYFDNQAEYDQFLKFIDTGNENLWIGVSRSNSQTGWSTVTTKEYKFQSWARGEPNNADGRENCVEYSAWHKDWNDQDCSDKNRFICRVKSMKASCIDFTRVSNLAVDWNTAKLKCKEAGGALAYFDNSLEYDQFSRQMGLGNSNEWLGVHRSSRDGWSTVEGKKNMFFQWMTAAGKRRLGYGGSDEPNNWGGKEDCVEYRGIHKKWNDSPCQNKNKFACRFDTCPQTHFGPILKKAISWTEAVKECSRENATVAYINNDEDLKNYKDAIGHTAFEEMVRPRVWLGRDNGNPQYNTRDLDCLKYEPHTGRIVKERCDQKMWFSCRKIKF
ncbi:unnamed protein product [Oikopleura dioica]|uniref:C-type lectin domain-containing protein n=1 Tax=Oikopleura dioica TaxID=34765 RepID=E4YBB0_OIKDI|nr:unnamed protein product [Oikopleura dioica]